jgi:hypothetical protein
MAQAKIQQLVGPQVLTHLPAAEVAALTGRRFFPQLISAPFQSGLHTAFAFAIAACLVAAVTSWSRGRRYVDEDASATQLRAQPERRAEQEATGQ